MSAAPNSSVASSSNRNPGIYNYLESLNAVGDDVFEGGTGSLPTDHTCGQ